MLVGESKIGASEACAIVEESREKSIKVNRDAAIDVRQWKEKKIELPVKRTLNER